jgi:hypothetical protein
MLLKWLFTLLAILWLIQALRPYFRVQQGPPPTPPPSDKNRFDRHGDYIDYEEIK